MKHRSGMTLIELMAVVVIIGILSTIVAANVIPSVDGSRFTKTITDLKTIKNAVTMYRLDTGSFPSELAQLNQSDAPKWGGPYLFRKRLLDAWDQPYMYHLTPEGPHPFALFSAGEPGTQPQPISVWDE